MLIIFLYQAIVLLLHCTCVALFDVQHNDVLIKKIDAPVYQVGKTAIEQ